MPTADSDSDTRLTVLIRYFGAEGDTRHHVAPRLPAIGEHELDGVPVVRTRFGASGPLARCEKRALDGCMW
jgi:hypothetical protein